MSETTTEAAPAAAAPAATPAPVPAATPSPAPATAATPDATTSTGVPGTDSASASGTSPAAASSDAAPAASSSDAEPPKDPAKPTSIISEAKSDAPDAPEAKPEDVAAEPAKPDAEPAPPPTYEAFKVPEGVKLDDAQVGVFNGILGEFEQRVAANPAEAHAAAQEMGQKFVDLYIAESQAAAQRWAEQMQTNWQRTQEQWQADFRKDPTIGGNQQQTTIKRIGALLDIYQQHAGDAGRTGIEEAFAMTGGGNHPEIIRFMNWAARRMTETARVVVPTVPKAPVVTSKAQRLYRNSNGAAAS